MPDKINVCTENEKRIANVAMDFLDKEYWDASEHGFYFRKIHDFFEASTIEGVFLAEYEIVKTDNIGIREEGAFTPA